VVVSDDQKEAALSGIGTMLTRLLTEACKEETSDAMNYEGNVALPTALEVLGSVAGQELFANEEVLAQLARISEYLDTDALEEVGISNR
jgi:hypothetical protein